MPKYGSRYGKLAMESSTSPRRYPGFGDFIYSGSDVASEKQIQMLNLVMDIGITPGDVDIIKRRTPVRTGRLRDSFSISDGDVISTAPYMGVVEQRHHMISDAIEEIGHNIIERVRKQLMRQKPFGIKVPIGTITIEV